jgi:hypothetical protein
MWLGSGRMDTAMIVPNITAKVDVPGDVTRSASNFLQRILGPVAEAIEFLSDKIRFYRFRSAIRTLERAKEITEASGITPKELPLKFLVPFLEDCSLEQEDSPFIEQWAKLLSSASKSAASCHQGGPQKYIFGRGRHHHISRLANSKGIFR